MLKIIFKALADMFLSLFGLLGPLLDSILTVGGEDNPHDFKGSFLEEGELLSKSNKGFCLTGTKSLPVGLSYRNGLVIGGDGKR